VRFDQWNLPAFGPFTDFLLDFPRGDVDLHILYGPNEAGKSSLLRAVRQMLFGIAARSEDDFLHEYRKLRAGGTVTNRDGTSLQFFRKKAQQQTLRDAADQPLSEHALVPFLGAVNEAYFTNMFGLTADQLRTGAKTLLKGEGDLGKALFSASLGGTPVQRIIESLQADADKIFKPLARGGTSLNAALETFGTLKRTLSEKQLKPEAWAELEGKIARAAERCEEFQAATISLRTEMDWLQRCQDALPTISQLQEAEQHLTAFAHLPEVSENFLPEARDAQWKGRRMSRALSWKLWACRISSNNRCRRRKSCISPRRSMSWRGMKRPRRKRRSNRWHCSNASLRRNGKCTHDCATWG